MTAVMVEIRPRHEGTDDGPAADAPLPTAIPDSETIEIISDIGGFAEIVMCSCSASDDNLY